jgi:hypothetical protein
MSREYTNIHSQLYNIGSTSMGEGESFGDGRAWASRSTSMVEGKVELVGDDGAQALGVSQLMVGGSDAVVEYFHCKKALVRDVRMVFQFDCCSSKCWCQVLVS